MSAPDAEVRLVVGKLMDQWEIAKMRIDNWDIRPMPADWRPQPVVLRNPTRVDDERYGDDPLLRGGRWLR